MIFAAAQFSGRRLRARRVDEEAFAYSVRGRALEEDRWIADVIHGGSVANAYGYSAETECVLAISDPNGIVVYWTGRASANKVTYRGAAEACVPGAGDLFDERIKSSERKELARKVLQDAHRREVPAMVVLAICAKEPSTDFS